MAFPDDRDLRLNRQAEHAWRLAVSLSDWAARNNPDRQRENLAPLSDAEEFELLQLRRRSEHLLSAAGVPVAAAVYGPSQSGKSLFLGHVLTPREPQYSPLGACPSIRLCSRIAPGFRWALAFSATAPALGAHYPPLNSSRCCRSGAKSSEGCGSSRSVATRPTPSPVLVTKTCGFPARI